MELKMGKSSIQYSMRIISTLFLCLLIGKAFSQEIVDKAAIHPSKIIIRLEPLDDQSQSSEARGRIRKGLKGLSADQLNRISGLKRVEEKFRQQTASTGRRQASPYLSNIYELDVEDPNRLLPLLDSLKALPGVRYAEPYYLHEMLTLPNDPEAQPGSGAQNYLEIIQAYEAWGVEQGDSTVIIASPDTGTQLDHIDLQGTIFFNHADPINGIDDDGDGFIDNYHGWDFADNNLDPSAKDTHGVGVIGVSSAEGNNVIGMAGLAFKSKNLPLKIYRDSDGIFNKGYEAIVYAADRGVKVINLSWGSAGNYSQFAQDIINYAVLEKDVTVVAAAGNTPSQLNFYPASYDHVISTGASLLNDDKTAWTTYSYRIDLLAPGQQIYTTRLGNTFYTPSGTSFAAPMVSATAALIRSLRPHLNARQVGEQIRISSDPIYHRSANEPFFGKLGKGRLNMYRALVDTLSPALRLDSLVINQPFPPYFFPGDTLSLQASFMNFLNTCVQCELSFSVDDSEIPISAETFQMGTIGRLERFNLPQALKLILPESLERGKEIGLRMDFKGEGYEDWQFYPITIAPLHLNLQNGLLVSTLASNGNMGYAGNNKSLGVGYRRNDLELISAMGILSALPGDKIAENVIYDLNKYKRESEFQSIEALSPHPQAYLTNHLIGRFRMDFGENVSLEVEQEAGFFDDLDDAYFISYRLINASDNSLDSLRFALFTDWMINDPAQNQAYYDEENRILVFKDTTNALFGGLMVLQDHDLLHRAIDMANFNGNEADVELFFTKEKKGEFLLQANEKLNAGQSGEGNHVAGISGVKIPTIPGKSDRRISFGILSAEQLEDLISSAEQLREHYPKFLAQVPTVEQVFLCKGDSTIITQGGEAFDVYADIAFQDTLALQVEEWPTGSIEKDSIFYLRPYQDNLPMGTRQYVISVLEPSAKILIEEDTVYLKEGKVSVYFENSSLDADQYYWDFGNNFSSNRKHAKSNYTEVGFYEVLLIASHSQGCSDTSSHTLYVAERPSQPYFEEALSTCYGSTLELQSSEGQVLEWYGQAKGGDLLFKGESFSIGPLLHDSTLYAQVNASGLVSKRVPVTLQVFGRPDQILVQVDTLHKSDPPRLMASLNNEGIHEWIWEIEDRTGTDSVFYFSIEEAQADQLKLKYRSDTGCEASLSLAIPMEKSINPQALTLDHCQGTPLLIQPNQAKGPFLFYRGEELAHIGSSWLIEEGLDSSISVQVVNYESFLPSDPVAIDVEIQEFVNNFRIEPEEVLILREGNTFQLFDESIGNINKRAWFINGNFVESARNPIFSLDSVGDLSITLTITHALGCQKSTEQVYRVVAVLSEAEIENKAWNLFPNPVKNSFVLTNAADFTHPPSSFEIISIDGKKMYKEDWPSLEGRLEINTQGFKPGLYLIKIHSDKGVHTLRFSKE